MQVGLLNKISKAQYHRQSPSLCGKIDVPLFDAMLAVPAVSSALFPLYLRIPLLQLATPTYYCWAGATQAYAVRFLEND